jgi:L-ornithine Nalpha-acyltransferase
MAPKTDLACATERPFEHRAPNLGGLPHVLAEISDLEVRLARTKREIRRAQELRYQVFFEEGCAQADQTARLSRRDICRFDAVCDHLIVVNRAVSCIGGSPSVVGAYRLLRQEVAEAHFGFYSATEFAIGDLMARQPGKRFLELGRSCVAQGYRGKRTLELLWRGIWSYALHHRMDIMFGCASFPGANPGEHAEAMQFLRADPSSSSEWEVRAAPGRAAPMTGLVENGSPRAVARALPPLIKGYWRLGARFSADAVVDDAFGTTDVLVVLLVEEIRHRYLAHFAPPQEAPEMAA